MSIASILRWLAAAALLVAVPACDTTDETPSDTAPPTATRATTTGTAVTVTFDEPVVVAGTFALSPGPSVSSATASGSQVTLTLSSELPDDDPATYTVSYSGVTDAAGNAGSGATTFRYPSGGSNNASDDIGAGYPNAGDSRINLFNTDGDRFLLFNPASGAVSGADDLNDVENGAIPLDGVGAAASVFGDEETVFFGLDGDTYTKYERDQSDFDPAASFEEEFDDSGYDLDGVGAAYGSTGERIVLFNRNGTQWQEWYTGSDGFTNVFSFPADFGDGSSPISSVGAAFYVEEANEVYLINRQGTQYTIWDGSFTAAFPVSDLGDFDF